MFDKKIEELRHHFGITVLEDWAGIRPEWIIARHGFGKVILDHLRLYLAQHGLTLHNDQTPEHWKKFARAGRIVTALSDPDDGDDRPIINPFTVLIDSAEQQPFTFQKIKTDASQGGKPLIVPTEWKSLGRHPNSLGDYSLSGGEGRCHVERKSMEDAQGTILGWDGRRERFECELQNLAETACSVIVVECSLAALIANAPGCDAADSNRRRGTKTVAQNAKALHRSVLAFLQDYRLPWIFSDSRRMAEIDTFRWLERWYRKQIERSKEESKQAKKQLELIGDVA
jgi:hypothetical protein